MPVLASFTYPQGAKFALQRQYIIGFAIGWQPDAFTIASGQTTILEEISFGGYRVVIKFKDWIWNWDDRGFVLDEMFEDFYALAPGGVIPISAGAAELSMQINETFDTCCIVVILPAPLDHYYFQRLPPRDRPYWMNVPDNMPATPFWYP